MGAFDQFKDKAEQAKETLDSKRNKSAGSGHPEQSERSAQQQGRERGSESGDKAKRSMDPESNEENQDDTWA